MKKEVRGVLWQGVSPINGAPVVAVVTPSANSKTGPMSQVWILAQELSPTDAVHAGEDVAVCGQCPLRSPRGLRGRSCYVLTYHAPDTVWRKYREGFYEPLEPDALRGLAVRWGAYGDPALLPWELVTRVNLASRGWTGYTHQWRKLWAQPFKGVFMASVETPQQEKRAAELGWGTFRAGRPDGADQGTAERCLNDVTGATCLECRRCDGRPARVYTPAHGTGRNFVPAARLRRA